MIPLPSISSLTKTKPAQLKSAAAFFALCSCCRQSAARRANSINNKKKQSQAVKTTTCFQRAAVLSPPESGMSLFLRVLKQQSSRFSQAAAERPGKQNPPPTPNMTGQPLSAAEVTKVTGGRASTGVNGNRKGHEVEAGQIRGTPFVCPHCLHLTASGCWWGHGSNNRPRKAHKLALLAAGLCTKYKHKWKTKPDAAA